MRFIVDWIPAALALAVLNHCGSTAGVSVDESREAGAHDGGLHADSGAPEDASDPAPDAGDGETKLEDGGGGMFCGPSTCDSNQTCCVQVLSGPSLGCVPAGTCPGVISAACMGPEMCDRSTPACCAKIVVGAAASDGGLPVSVASACTADPACPGDIAVGLAGGSIETKLCTSPNDCVNYAGSLNGVLLPVLFGSCCTPTSAPVIHFCAPNTFGAGPYSCM
jgi:hypothetical protein